MSRECSQCGAVGASGAVRCDKCGARFEVQHGATGRGFSPLHAGNALTVIALIFVAIAVITMPQGERFGQEPWRLVAVLLGWFAQFWWLNRRRRSSGRDRRQPEAASRAPGTFVAPPSLGIASLDVGQGDPIDVVVWLPTLQHLEGRVLSPEHVLGRLTRSVKDGGALEPGNFVENDAFLHCLQEFLARELPARPELRVEARRIGEGWVTCVDRRVLDAPRERAATDADMPDMEDVFGRFRVQQGLIDPQSYQRNAAYKLLTRKGVFQLEFALRERLKDEIIARHAFRQAGEIAAGAVM